MSNYWDRYWQRHTSRRRFLGTGATLGAGAAGLALVGCGDDDDDDGGDGNGDGGGNEEPTTAPSNGDNGSGEGNYGGTVRYPYTGTSSGDPPTLFPWENITFRTQNQASLHYSRLLAEYAGPDVAPGDYTALEGDLAASMPEQPDDVTYVFTLRDNIHFHDKEPMNGRQATAQDVVDSYNAFISISPNAATWENVIDRFEAVDDMTVEVQLNAPHAPFLTVQASTFEGFWFIPVESIDGGQAHDEGQVGTGPWVFDRYESGVSLSWNRNENYYREGWPYFDRVEVSLVGEPERILSSLSAGDLDFSTLAAGLWEDGQDQLNPEGQHITAGASAPESMIWFNFDNDGGRWRDIRLRQALSMSINRESIMNAADPTGQGDWQSPFVTPMLKPYFLSPMTEDYGENGKFFEYNPEEARTLIEAATGESNPHIVMISSPDGYGALAQQRYELIHASLREVGWDVEERYMEYGRYITSAYNGDMDEGVGLGYTMGTVRDPHDHLSRSFASSSARRNWAGTAIDEQDRIDELIEEQEAILDVDERVEFIHEMQREFAEYLLFIPGLGVPNYFYAQPWMQNYHQKVGYALHQATMSRAWFSEDRLEQG